MWRGEAMRICPFTLGMRVYHPEKTLQLVDIDGNSRLETTSLTRSAELHPMHQIQFIRDTPKERPQLDRWHEFNDLSTRLAK